VRFVYGSHRAMTLFKLVETEAGAERQRIFVAAVATGVANALVLSRINALAHSSQNIETPALLGIVCIIVVYIVSARYVNIRLTALVHAVMRRIKMRVGDKITRIELDTLERIDAAEICDRITENCANIADKALILATMMQSAIILVCAAIYLAWLSIPAFVLLTGLCLVCAQLFLDVRRAVGGQMRETGKKRLEFFARITDLLSGFKEVQFSRARGRDLRMHIEQSSDELRKMAVNSSNFMSHGSLLGDTLLFALLAAVVYGLRAHVPMDAKTLGTLVAAVNFLFGPYHAFMRGYLQYGRANAALDEIAILEKKIDIVSGQAARLEGAEDPWQSGVSVIQCCDVEYEYAANEGREQFRIGPINLQLRAGEVVFIVGGNGSGKSTLLRVLTGLSPPNRGTLLVDGIAVGPDNVATYRDMISAIFSDFHLFPRLYGMSDKNSAVVNGLIGRMRLDGQTSFTGKTFTKLTLSTGQRKRLAMVVALLEERPIVVFDEWAAEQDPEFREYFYQELLPQFRDEGKIVIVVTHDDRYFHCANRVVTMDYGTIRSVEIAPRNEVV
jgi:putative ATP-binding cassette transporter